MAKEDVTGQSMEPSTNQVDRLLEINRKQSEIISAQAKNIESSRGCNGLSLEAPPLHG